MRNKTLAYLTLLCCSLPGANSYAGKDGETCEHRQRHHHHAKHFVPMHDKIIRQLDLSEVQQRQLKALREESKPKLRAQHEALRENHRQMHELITSGDYSEDKASRLAERQGEIASEMARLEAAEMAGLYALLTPDQQKKFSAFKFEGGHHGKDKHKN